MSTIDPVFREKLRAVLISWVDEIEKHVRRAQADGYLKPDVEGGRHVRGDVGRGYWCPW